MEVLNFTQGNLVTAASHSLLPPSTGCRHLLHAVMVELYTTTKSGIGVSGLWPFSWAETVTIAPECMSYSLSLCLPIHRAPPCLLQSAGESTGPGGAVGREAASHLPHLITVWFPSRGSVQEVDSQHLSPALPSLQRLLSEDKQLNVKLRGGPLCLSFHSCQVLCFWTHILLSPVDGSLLYLPSPLHSFCFLRQDRTL